MADKLKPHTYERREVLALAGTGVIAVAGIGLFPGGAQADHIPRHIDVAKAIKDKIGDKPTKSGRITMELPQIAENGNTVPMGFEIESPMTDGDISEPSVGLLVPFLESPVVLADGVHVTHHLSRLLEGEPQAHERRKAAFRA